MRDGPCVQRGLVRSGVEHRVRTKVRDEQRARLGQAEGLMRGDLQGYGRSRFREGATAYDDAGREVHGRSAGGRGKAAGHEGRAEHDIAGGVRAQEGLSRSGRGSCNSTVARQWRRSRLQVIGGVCHFWIAVYVVYVLQSEVMAEQIGRVM